MTQTEQGLITTETENFTSTFTIINNTMEPIRSIHIKRTDLSTWGGNLLHASISPGNHATIEFSSLEEYPYFDIQARNNVRSYTIKSHNNEVRTIIF